MQRAADLAHVNGVAQGVGVYIDHLREAQGERLERDLVNFLPAADHAVDKEEILVLLQVDQIEFLCPVDLVLPQLVVGLVGRQVGEVLLDTLDEGGDHGGAALGEFLCRIVQYVAAQTLARARSAVALQVLVEVVEERRQRVCQLLAGAGVDVLQHAGIASGGRQRLPGIIGSFLLPGFGSWFLRLAAVGLVGRLRQVACLEGSRGRIAAGESLHDHLAVALGNG